MSKIRCRDIDLYYEITGEGKPILFLHGLGSSCRDWEYQVRYFSKRYQVITFDFRGHGQSDKPEGPYSIPLFAWDTAELIRTLDIMPVHVVGISLGGMVGLQLAVDEPGLVRSLVSVNCVSEMVFQTMKQRLAFLHRLLIIRLFGMRKMGEILGKRLFPNPEQWDLRQMFSDRWAENDPKTYREALKGIVGWRVTGQLSQIRCPTLVIAAEHDYTPVETKMPIVNGVEGAALEIIENSYHATPVDQPEAFNRVVSAFLTG